MDSVLRRQQQQQTTADFALQYCKDFKSWLRDYITAIKHGRWHPFSPTERKVREATRNEAWGPTGTQLNEINELSFEHDECIIIMAVVEARLNYPPEKWRNVYKGLQVLEFLLKRGSSQCIEVARQDLLDKLEYLKNFQFIDTDMKDYGINVRIRSEAISNMLKDEERLKQERRAFKSSVKYKGYSREEMASCNLGNKHKDDDDDDDGRAHRANSWTLGDSDNKTKEIKSYNKNNITSSQRGAGEMKGISLEENKKNIEALKLILSREENKVCADCVGSSARPTWASINCGTFICMRCAGFHRGLGVHVSKVRSCTLDTWLPEQVEFMSKTGNKIANNYWEGNLSEAKPNVDDVNLGEFIKRKYVEKLYIKGTWPPSFHETTDVVEIQQQVITTRQVEKPKFNIRIQPQVQKSLSLPKSQEQDLLNFEDNAFKTSFELRQDLEVKSADPMFNFQVNSQFDSFNKNPDVLSKSYGNCEMASTSYILQSNVNDHQIHKQKQSFPFSSPKAPEKKSINFGRFNSYSKQRDFSIDNKNEFASLTSELDKKNKVQKPQSPPLNDIQSSSKQNNLFTFPKSNFTFFGLSREEIIRTEEYNIDDLDSLSETTSVASRSYAPSIASHPKSKLTDIDECDQIPNAVSAPDLQNISPSVTPTQSHINQTYTPVIHNNIIPKPQLFEDHAFMSHHQNSNPSSSNNFEIKPPPSTVAMSYFSIENQQNKTQSDATINLLDAPLSISTQTSLPDNYINNSKDPFDRLPPIELITANSTPPDISQIPKSNLSVVKRKSLNYKYENEVRDQNAIDVMSLGQVEALRLGSLSRDLRNPTRSEPDYSQQMMSSM